MNTLTYCQTPHPGFSLGNVEVVHLELKLRSLAASPDPRGRVTSWLRAPALELLTWVQTLTSPLSHVT